MQYRRIFQRAAAAIVPTAIFIGLQCHSHGPPAATSEKNVDPPSGNGSRADFLLQKISVAVQTMGQSRYPAFLVRREIGPQGLPAVVQEDLQPALRRSFVSAADVLNCMINKGDKWQDPVSPSLVDEASGILQQARVADPRQEKAKDLARYVVHRESSYDW